MPIIKPSGRRRLRARDSNADLSSCLLSPVNKRLNFSFDAGDASAAAAATGSVVAMNNNHVVVAQADSTTANTCDPSSSSSSSTTQFYMDMDPQLIMLDEAYLRGDGAATAASGGFDNFSPCRTRSGCVYESGLKKQRFRVRSSSKRVKTSAVSPAARVSGVRSRACSGQSGTGSIADCSENGSDADENCAALSDLVESSVCDRLDYYSAPQSPPPLNYSKIPVSRFSQARERTYRHDIPSSPISGMLYDQDRSSPCRTKHWSRQEVPCSPVNSFSPPTNTMRAMRLFDGMSSPNTACALLSSPRSTPKGIPIKSRLLFDEDGEHRRASCPNPLPHHVQTLENGPAGSTGKKKTANINPFTPSAMLAMSKKRSRSQKSLSSSYEELQHSLNSLSDAEEGGDGGGGRSSPLPAKRVRVSDINITRYDEEFLELSEIASGQFGTVKRARHRLDGMIYAVKVTKKPIRVNSHDEKVAMNEVFAHAALIKHKHVVRYYNSWVEKGQVYIQNEFCEGGSLQKQIEAFRQNGGRFSEAELKRIIVHVAKGLQYIHSKQLVHLDIKPGNIFISLEYITPSPPRKTEHSTDSGAASGDHSPCPPLRADQATPVDPQLPPQQQQLSSCESSPGDGEKVHYKIGDLGHVASIFGGDVDPEEGDCRYMAPEFLEMKVDRSRLPKADIFSLGLTVYEAASLKQLPKNSLDDPVYERIKRGELEYLDQYSRELNSLLRLMVHPDPAARPSATKILAHHLLNPTITKSRSQLYKELKEARDKVAQLEQQLLVSTNSALLGYQDKENSAPPSEPPRTKLMKRLVGRGQTKASSCLV